MDWVSAYTWDELEIKDTDHVKSISSFDVSKDEELKQAFTWKNTPTLTKESQFQRRTKYKFLDYRLKFVRAYQFIRLQAEGVNEDPHWWVYSTPP